jgi:hypothetical protein
MKADREEPGSPEPVTPRLEDIDPKVAAAVAARIEAENLGVYDDAEGYDDGNQRDAHRAVPDEHS